MRRAITDSGGYLGFIGSLLRIQGDQRILLRFKPCQTAHSPIKKITIGRNRIHWVCANINDTQKIYWHQHRI